MKAKLVSAFSEKDVRKYWQSIDAPITLRRLSNSDDYSIMKRPGCQSDAANIFLLQSTKLNPLQRDSLIRKIIIGAKHRGITFHIDNDIPSPVEVLTNIRGKFL